MQRREPSLKARKSFEEHCKEKGNVEVFVMIQNG